MRTEIERAVAACRGSLLIIMGFSLCINVLALASPLYMLQLYDRVLSSRSIDTLVMLMIIVIAALGLMSLLDGLRRLMLARIAMWLDDCLGPTVLRGALVSALRIDDAQSARSMRDLEVLRGFLSGTGVMPLMDIPWTPIFVAALFALHPLLGAIGIGSAILLFGLGMLNEIATRAPLREANAAALWSQRQAEATLRNAEVIRAMGLFDGIVAMWQRDGDRAKAAQLIANDRGAAILAVSKFCRLAVQTLIMGAGAWLVIEDNGSAGTIFASSFLLSRALARWKTPSAPGGRSSRRASPIGGSSRCWAGTRRPSAACPCRPQTARSWRNGSASRRRERTCRRCARSRSR
jgi:ABC-type protease/lipase transport system fused ATPase/permease subunit